MQRSARIALTLVTAAGALVMLTPFLYMVGTALNPERWVMPFPPRIWPEHPTLAHFARAWTEAGFQRGFLNSLLVAVTATLITFVVATLSAYAFARLPFPGKEALFSIYLVSMMVPEFVALLPKFEVVVRLHLNNSYFGLWALYVAAGVAGNTFLLRGFFEHLPRELEEATMIDGGSRFTIYSRVLLPLARPALATLCIFSFLGAWDEFWWASLLLQNQKLWTLQIAMRMFQGVHATQWGTVFAATTLATLPNIIIFALFQRQFVGGMNQGAVKG